jgi:hypothetical protein
MLRFLSISDKRKFRVDRYTDNAVGIIEKYAVGKLAMTRVTLRPHFAQTRTACRHGAAPAAIRLSV